MVMRNNTAHEGSHHQQAVAACNATATAAAEAEALTATRTALPPPPLTAGDGRRQSTQRLNDDKVLSIVVLLRHSTVAIATSTSIVQELTLPVLALLLLDRRTLFETMRLFETKLVSTEGTISDERKNAGFYHRSPPLFCPPVLDGANLIVHLELPAPSIGRRLPASIIFQLGSTS
jgi:hypothetical protein